MQDPAPCCTIRLVMLHDKPHAGDAASQAGSGAAWGHLAWPVHVVSQSIAGRVTVATAMATATAVAQGGPAAGDATPRAGRARKAGLTATRTIPRPGPARRTSTRNGGPSFCPHDHLHRAPQPDALQAPSASSGMLTATACVHDLCLSTSSAAGHAGLAQLPS